MHMGHLGTYGENTVQSHEEKLKNTILTVTGMGKIEKNIVQIDLHGRNVPFVSHGMSSTFLLVTTWL